MFLKVALALGVTVAPAFGQTIEPEGRPAQAPKQGQAVNQTDNKSVPWLVTILYQISVKDLITDLQGQGLTVSAVEGIPESQSITNIVSGLVMTSSGQVVSRLANFRVQPKPDSLTVITADGRHLKPKSVEYDPASGYSILQVPDLAIQPPPFASASMLLQQAQNYRLLYQVPDWVHVEVPEVSSSAGRQQPRKGSKRSVVTVNSDEKARGQTFSFRVIEDNVHLKSKEKEWVVLDKLDKVPLEIQPLDAPDGSIVLNTQGEVIGLMEFLGPAKGMVKSIEDLRKMADRLIMRDQAHRGWLGVRLVQLSGEEVRRQFGIEPAGSASVVVKDVFPNSPAAQADLRPKDFIRRISGQEITGLQELSQMLANTPVGAEVPLEVMREGVVKEVRVRIEPRPKLASAMPRRTARPRSDSPEDRRSTERELARDSRWRGADCLSRIGIQVDALTRPLREFFGIEGLGGVLVTEVNTSGVAGQAGLQAGDAIVAVNGRRVINSRYLEALINRAARLGKATLSVTRQREPMKITLDLSKAF